MSTSNKKVREHSIDRISDLIDPIRCHILSFLPTVNAVETSFLSTKWRNLWTSLSNLSFQESPHHQNFPRFVNRVLLFHNAQSINKFTLSCLQNFASYDVHAWITFAIRKNVQEVEVSLKGSPLVQLPISLFSCKTLEVLKLKGSISIKMPTTLALPKVTRLELIEVTYENDESARNLVSSCTSLETLDVVRGIGDNVGIFMISSSTLRHLSVDIGFFELLVLPKIIINAPALQTLVLLNSTVRSFEIQNLSSSLNLRALTEGYLFPGVNSADLILNFLRGIRNVKTLYMTQEVFQAYLPGYLIPKFDNLTTLEVLANCCEWGLLQHFIKNSRQLKNLTFTQGACLTNRSEHRVCWKDPECVPSCLVTSLDTVSVVDFEGFEDELAMVEYILKNGLVMRTMKIKPYSFFHIDEMIELFQDVFAFRRGSKECKIIVEKRKSTFGNVFVQI